MKRLLMCLALTGCAATGPQITGTEHAVNVNWYAATSSNTLPAAEAHCAKYGKHAQFSGKPNHFTDAYACVKL